MALRDKVFLALLLALGTTCWRHLALVGVDGPSDAFAPALIVDAMLALPVAALAVAAVERAARRQPGLFTGRTGALTTAAAQALVLAVLQIPLTVAQAAAPAMLGSGGAHRHGGPLPRTDFLGLFGYGVTQAVQVEVAALVLAMIGVVVLRLVRHLERMPAPVPVRRPIASVPWCRLLVVVLVASAVYVPTAPADAAPREAAAAGGCAGAHRRVFDVYAIDVDIVVDRFGDHDPYGYMYVLADREDDVRAQEAALQAASAAPKNDPNAAKVSPGLGQDPIQPLVMRGRLGECVVINLTNKLTKAPRSGLLGNPPITLPGGVPSVSIDMTGVAYDAAAGEGGQAVGTTPVDVMAEPGRTRQYQYFLDPTMGEGAKVFRSGGDSTQLTAHGLFGALVAEPTGSNWLDPVTGQDRTGDTGWSSWEAMVKPAKGLAFREFTLLYHEIGDENFNLRRPLRENSEGVPIGGDTGVPVGDQVQYGRPLPMIDTRPPIAGTPTEGGAGTNSYRPGSRAINYRSESFYRRLQLEAARGRPTQLANKSLAYSSYTYGDPATPMPRSYLGEPTKTRIAQAGGEQLHVHHVHGGGTRWLLDPGVDDTALGAGLSKTPGQNATSIRLDSQTVSPLESFNLEHECGAGGCQQAAGDFLYHCHIAQHYIAGMWGLWRVFDTAQPGLARLPDRTAAPTAVNAAGLVGLTVEGKRVVPQAQLTDPQRQVAVQTLVEQQLPPQGARWGTANDPDPDDATVWDWAKGGSDSAPTYLGEPETGSVWANYRSAQPGTRPEIMFNPITGRPAYPLLRPHLGMRPPFSPNGHAGAPGVGEVASTKHPGGLCPRRAPVRTFNITAIPVQIQATDRERDNQGEIYVLNEDRTAVLDGSKPVDPLVIRSNVGDCESITFGSELDPAVQSKVNMHTHLVQFDPLASDGVVAGFAFEQAVFSDTREGRSLVSTPAPNQIAVSNVDKLRTGISIGIGVGRPTVEIRTITGIDGNRLVLDAPLAKSHPAGEPVTVEFVQYRWFSDVDSGTVFWHDHVNGIASWAHGLFAAHIIEPKGSTYHDPKTGAKVRSGTIVDIINRSGGSVGVGQSGSFREFTIFVHNGRRGRSELRSPPSGSGLNPFNAGQECEEGSINLRAAPIGERVPPGATPADPTSTDQRQEFNGALCRNAFRRTGDNPANPDANSARATITTVDPYTFSSTKYGDPSTPLLRAYAGDPVVFRTVGVNDRAEALRVQGHRFRMERFQADGQLMDTATTGISERFDYVLDGGAGGPSASPGDYLYYSTRTFALESGAWGIFRVHDKEQADLKPLPGRQPARGGGGFPRQVAATGDTQQKPGPNPAPAYNTDGTVNTAVVTSSDSPCPAAARKVSYQVSILDKSLPTAPFVDEGGVIYALSSDVAAIRAGTKAVEPLVLRANKGDCVSLVLHNEISAGSMYGGIRAGLDLSKMVRNQQLSSGGAIGLNPDSTVVRGATITQTFFADQELGTSLFQNLGSVASLRHGAYGMLIIEPRGSTWFDSVTDAPLGSTTTSTQAIIRVPGAAPFREMAITIQSTDQQFGRSILPYVDQVAGNGINSPGGTPQPPAPVPGAPPGRAGNAGTYDKGYSHVSYRSEPLTRRLGLTTSPDYWPKATVVGSYGTAFSSTPHGDPGTPTFAAISGDPVVFRVGIGASDQLHSFTVSGHTFPIEPRMPGAQMMSARTIAAGETLDAYLGPAGGGTGNTGDYLYQDARLPFAAAGIWGILRVLPKGAAGAPARL